MCCFSGPVKSVSATNIFARLGDSGRQFIVYSMTLDTADPVAMVLPIPVSPGTDDTGVRFLDLQDYATFFDDLNTGFPKPDAEPSHAIGDEAGIPESANNSLPVIPVGNFEASFVPTPKDFTRLDARFRLPEAFFDKMPAYQHFGFAVFKLKAGVQKIHPMAFDFPSANPAKLFFPTVHIHDGQIHEHADFDHTLFCQPSDSVALKLADWTESPKLAYWFMDLKHCQDIILPESHCYKHELHGDLPNTDTCVTAA